MPKPCETAARKMPKRCFWNPLKTRQNRRKRCLGSACEKAEPQAGFVPKPLRNYSLKVLGERMRKSRAPAGFVPKPLRNYSLKVLGERMRKSRAPAGFVPKPLRNCSRKNAETLLLEPTNKIKTKKSCPSHAKAQPKKCRHEERLRNTRTAAGFVPKSSETAAKKKSLTLPTERSKEREQRNALTR